MTTETASKETEMVSLWSMGFVWITTGATEIELSASVGGETEVIHDVTASSEDVNDVFIRAEFNDFLFAALPVAAEVLLALNNNVWSEDEVVSLPSVDELVVVEDGQFPDLVGAWWVVLEDCGITEMDSVTVGLASLEFSLLERALHLEDWLNVQVEIVDMATVASSEDSEVLAERGLGLEFVTASSTESELSALAGLETELIEDVTISSEENCKEFISFEFNAGFLDTWVKVGASQMLATSDNHVWSVDEVISLETKDKLVVVPNSQFADLVDTAVRLKESFVVEGYSVTMSLSSEEFVGLDAVRLEAANPWEWVNIEVDVVEMSTETSSETREVLAVWGLKAEWVSARSTEFP
mmetsp:Transcript_57293/g.65638  ORF Transcript_57293/g.65638 Transcript_57293/m.65638 type:complete len:355 (-) Transcript_57293:376-1440(-)